MIDKHSAFNSFEEENVGAIHHNKFVSVEEYFDIQFKETEKEYDIHNPVKYYGYPFCKQEIYTHYCIEHQKQEHMLTVEDYIMLHQPFNNTEPTQLLLMEYLDLNKYTENIYFIQQIKLITLNSDLLFGVYILIKSFHTLSNISVTLEVLKMFTLHTKNINPFIIS